MMTAKASGKAENNARAPNTNQVSLPSQIGATDAIIRSRARSSGANGKRMPIPRSKPSSNTYMNTPNPSRIVQTGTRSRLMADSSNVGSGGCGKWPRRALIEPQFVTLDLFGRSLPHQAHQVVGAGAKDDDVYRDVGEKRCEHVAAGERRTHCVRRAQESVHYIGLPADFSRDPACSHGHIARRNHPGRRAQKNPRDKEALAPGEPPCPDRECEHDRPHAHHNAEAEEHRRHRRAIGWREVFESPHHTIPTVREIETPQLRDR